MLTLPLAIAPAGSAGLALSAASTSGGRSVNNLSRFLEKSRKKRVDLTHDLAILLWIRMVCMAQ
jgi:hypothetical protein